MMYTFDRVSRIPSTSFLRGAFGKLNHCKRLISSCLSWTRSAAHTNLCSSLNKMFFNALTRISSTLWTDKYRKCQQPKPKSLQLDFPILAIWNNMYNTSIPAVENQECHQVFRHLLPEHAVLATVAPGYRYQ